MRKAIYREYRPKTFDEVLGQEQVTEVLKNQVKNNLISHAYIFSGTRGTGKTSCAKILARAVNCLNPHDGSPCNECENCKMILSEESFDIVEMDAASNRRIEDIRNLRDKVIFPPANLKYKVYIIDEAHMITNEGFNALLKIMEEPPKHLVFILATTEIEKIPQTILSRCQRFEFNRMDSKYIIENIKKITNDLGVKIDEESLVELANEADGAMRDALSNLDQVLSLGKKEITIDDLVVDLGLADRRKIFYLVEKIIENDYKKSLKLYREITKDKVIAGVFKDIQNQFRNLLYIKEGLDDFVEETVESKKLLKKQSELISTNRIVESLNILLDYEVKLKNTQNPNILGEILIGRLIDYYEPKEDSTKIKFLMERVESLEKKLEQLKDRPVYVSKSSSVEPVEDVKLPVQEESLEIEAEVDPEQETEETFDEVNEELENIDSSEVLEEPKQIPDKKYREIENWDELLENIPGKMLAGFVDSATHKFIDGKRVSILFRNKDTRMGMIINNREKVENAIKKTLGKDFKLFIGLEEDYEDLAKKRREENIETLKNVFGKENIDFI
ncbi:DNA polymerase III subunit gamma/tau [Mediannikoviicoccus vaginalis]|uniref:DNA polymerase III subunit gamma/tau n=1 Tax=Mediannikoviicoccus vaginalis TaxID=2899727 RepID=UPI001EFFBD63|nr:DNA polymerase III subunit gamma/tau [Mediannikoviicoccus vaginalis]